MPKKTLRAVISAAVLVTATTLVLYATVANGAQFFKHVDEVMVSPESWYGKRMQLHGFVVADSIEKRRDSMDYRFKLRNGDHAVLANYTGIVPDTFKDGAEVVITGRLGPNGFQATEMTAKCPSKYEAAGPPATTIGR
jgi:cytochrome c-type biogenesis protein CcmE